MHAVLKHRLPAATLRKVMFSAHRFTAREALAAGIVDEIVEGDGESVIARALVIAKEQAKHSTSGVRTTSPVPRKMYSSKEGNDRCFK